MTGLLRRLEDGLFRRLVKRRHDRLVAEYGGIQKCPWCKNWAQEGPGWCITPSHDEPACDVLTCGVCGGTSLWHWAMGFIPVAPLNPPKPPDNWGNVGFLSHIWPGGAGGCGRA